MTGAEVSRSVTMTFKNVFSQNSCSRGILNSAEQFPQTFGSQSTTITLMLLLYPSAEAVAVYTPLSIILTDSCHIALSVTSVASACTSLSSEVNLIVILAFGMEAIVSESKTSVNNTSLTVQGVVVTAQLNLDSSWE